MSEWEQYQDRYRTRPQTFDAYVDVWNRLPEVREAFPSWLTFARAANAEPAETKRNPDRVEAAETLMRSAGYEIGEPTQRGARQWEQAARTAGAGAGAPAGDAHAPKIVVFGASGYTGRLVVAELVARGVEPVLAGRHGDRLAKIADEHGGLQVALADASDQRSVNALVDTGDVLISTVGPFTLHGHTAVDAAIEVGAHYLDSTGEASFIRHVINDAGPRAELTGSALLTAFGYDFVPGHLAGALAVAAGGSDAYELQIVYGGLGQRISSGTRSTAQVMLTETTHRLELARLVERPMGRDVSVFDLQDGRHHAMLVGGTEPLVASRAWPGAPSVSVWLDLGPVVWLAKAASYALPTLMSVPWLRNQSRRVGDASGGGPSAADRARSTTTVTAIARDVTGHELTRSVVHGPNPYDFTATALAVGALELATRGAPRPGALGPLDLFGHLALDEIAAQLGLHYA